VARSWGELDSNCFSPDSWLLTADCLLILLRHIILKCDSEKHPVALIVVEWDIGISFVMLIIEGYISPFQNSVIQSCTSTIIFVRAIAIDILSFCEENETVQPESLEKLIPSIETCTPEPVESVTL
jgi:hypothetical protein